MNKIKWNKKFSFNIRPIDQDHKSLFEVADRLQDQLLKKQKAAAILPTIDSLILYAKEHFDREERYMRRVNFPSYRAHKKMHGLFNDTVLGLSNLYKDNPEHVDPNLVLTFMINWLSSHILKEDRQYVPYLLGEYSRDSNEEDSEIQEPIEIKVKCEPDDAEIIQLFAELIDGDHKDSQLLVKAVEKIKTTREKSIRLAARKRFCYTGDTLPS